MNEGPVPKAAISRPEIAGPIKRPALKFAELRLTAFGKSLCPTISAANAWRTGASIAVEIPSTPAKTNTCHKAMCSDITRAPNINAENAPRAFVPINSLRLLKRSARAPPCKEKNRTGVNWIAVTIPK